MEAVDLIKQAEQPTAVVHERVPMDQLPQFFGRAFHEVSDALKAQGLKPAGPPFALYFGMPGKDVEVEAGFPVDEAVQDAGVVHPGHLPGGPAVKTLHVGPYDKMGDTYSALAQWISEHGLTPHQQMYEVYLSDPVNEPDPASWRTEVVWPVD